MFNNNNIIVKQLLLSFIRCTHTHAHTTTLRYDDHRSPSVEELQTGVEEVENVGGTVLNDMLTSVYILQRGYHRIPVHARTHTHTYTHSHTHKVHMAFTTQTHT